MNRITNEQREAIVREAVAKRDALLTGAPMDGYVLVPVEAPESLRGQLCGYGADLGYMTPRDRAVIVKRGAERWAEILRWASAAPAVQGPQPTQEPQ